MHNLISSETFGITGQYGVYLEGKTHWYVDLPDSLVTYRVKTITPLGYEVVTSRQTCGKNHKRQ